MRTDEEFLKLQEDQDVQTLMRYAWLKGHAKGYGQGLIIGGLIVGVVSIGHRIVNKKKSKKEED